MGRQGSISIVGNANAARTRETQRGHVVFSIAQATDACHLLFTMIPHLHPDVRIKVFALIRDKVQTSTAGVVGCQDVEDKLLVTVGNKELSDSFTIAPSLAAS